MQRRRRDIFVEIHHHYFPSSVGAVYFALTGLDFFLVCGSTKISLLTELALCVVRNGRFRFPPNSA